MTEGNDTPRLCGIVEMNCERCLFRGRIQEQNYLSHEVILGLGQPGLGSDPKQGGWQSPG